MLLEEGVEFVELVTLVGVELFVKLLVSLVELEVGVEFVVFVEGVLLVVFVLFVSFVLLVVLVYGVVFVVLVVFVIGVLFVVFVVFVEFYVVILAGTTTAKFTYVYVV